MAIALFVQIILLTSNKILFCNFFYFEFDLSWVLVIFFFCYYFVKEIFKYILSK